MSRIFAIALGILAAIGGYIDIGDTLFAVQAGSLFGYQLLWAVVVAVVGITVYAEMCGRVAACSGRAVFDAVRERMGFSAGLVTLVAAELVNLMTIAAEIGGIGLVLQLLSGLPYRGLLVVALVAVASAIWLLPFGWIERVFGYTGLAVLVFVVATFKLDPDWGRVAEGFVPSAGSGDALVYAYFAVGVISSGMIPYEVYFYSSGAVEEQWRPKDLGLNRANALVGYGFAGVISLAMMIAAGALLLPRGITAELAGTIALIPATAAGQIGLLLFLVGFLFAVGGAAIDASFSGAYILAQFFGWEWGKYRHNAGAPLFALTWIAMLLAAFLIVLTGVDPILVTEYSVIFSVVALPLTYLPTFLVANDRAYMGAHANGTLANVLGFAYLLVICVCAVAALPLLFLTNMGQG